MTQKVRLAIQVFAVALAGFLMLAGFWRFNLLFIFSSFVVALLAERAFCGWLCPLGFWAELMLRTRF